jgi:hypothetical protein
VGWFGSLVHDVTHPGQLISDGEHFLGQVTDEGAHLVGRGLTDVGLGQLGNTVDGWGDDAASALDPELQLGQTDDPAQLIHGDPGAIRSVATSLHGFSGAFGQTASGLNGIDTSHWTGAAADAFRARYSPEPGKWRTASSASGDAGGAMGSYADTVQWAQGQAREAIALYAQGQKATSAAVTAYNDQVSAYNAAARAYDAKLSAGQNPGTRPAEPGAFSDPGASMRDQAQAILTSARAERDRAGTAAASVVSKATGQAPASPGFWSQVGDTVTDTAQGTQLAQASFSAGVVTGVADIGKLVRTVNPYDPWNMEHPAEYLAGLSSVGAGLVHDAVHPQDLVEQMVGSGWGSDPAEALGKLVPQVALAVATGGGGAAADAATDAGVDAATAAATDAGTDVGTDAGTGAASDLPPLNVTKGILERYKGEEVPGNSVWGGSAVKYLNESERGVYQITIKDGKLYDSDGNLFDTSSGGSVHSPGDPRAIYVVDKDGNLYASNEQIVGQFHHSSFMAGGDVAGAGELKVVNGQLELITDSSGHYQPTQAMTDQVVQYLRARGVNISDGQVVKIAPN